MRTLAAVTMAGLVAIMVAGAATAAPSVDLIWTGTTGAGVTGSNSIDAAAGDTLTLEVRVNADAEGLTGWFLTLGWDAADLTGQNAVECPSPPNLAPGLCSNSSFNTWSPLTPGVVIDNGARTAYQFDGANTNPSVTTGFTVVAGTIQYVLGASATSEAISLIYSPGDEVVSNNAFTAYFPPASAFVVVPEPATGGLLALGLGALAFVGRRRA